MQRPLSRRRPQTVGPTESGQVEPFPKPSDWRSYCRAGLDTAPIPQVRLSLASRAQGHRAKRPRESLKPYRAIMSEGGRVEVAVVDTQARSHLLCDAGLQCIVRRKLDTT